jgi:pimeloyl-ACP methyl ester carboxylesterase
MTSTHCTRLLLGVGLLAVCTSALAQSPTAASDAAQTYTVFLQSRPIGQETATLVPQPDGWLLKGTNRLGPPIDVVTRRAEIHYTSAWQPTRMTLETIVRGQEVTVKTAFANGEAANEVLQAGSATPSTKTDKVTADTIVLPNTFLTSYLVLARRLVGQKPGTQFTAYIAPQGEVGMRLDASSAERIETPKQVLTTTRYSVMVSNPQGGSDIQLNVWTDAAGALLRLSVPAQALEIAREDIASAATRTTAFSIPGEESVRIPASGFGMAASCAKPATAAGPLPAVILVSGSSSGDRDGIVAGIPVLGQIAADLVGAGIAVVRYDRRGTGQSGGRSETTTINDYAEDVRAIVTWLEKQRRDVDKRRIAIVGHGDGAWIAMTAAARDGRLGALVLASAASTVGSELVLERQRRVLDQLQTAEADKQAKIELQRKINAATTTGAGWDGVPVEMRRSAETPWFQSYLAFDPARVMRDVRQPVLIVQGALDSEVPPHHGEKLAELARARKRKVATEVAALPSLNHLLVPAQTGTVDEYAVLPDKRVSPAATAAIGGWITRVLAERAKSGI